MTRPLIIGVTGGIASGKSTIAEMISGPQIAHINADKLVHDLLQNDEFCIAAIAAAIPGVVSGKAIDRAALAAHISKHPEALATLESILHPRVRALEIEAIKNARENGLRALVMDIPLLFETDAEELCDKVIVAHAPLEARRSRAFARTGMTDEKWQRLLARQLPNHHAHPRADVVIDTGADLAETQRQVAEFMKSVGL